jgi:hypothetical protein
MGSAPGRGFTAMGVGIHATTGKEDFLGKEGP